MIQHDPSADAQAQLENLAHMRRMRDEAYTRFLNQLTAIFARISPDTIVNFMHDEGPRLETVLVRLHDYEKMAAFGIDTTYAKVRASFRAPPQTAADTLAPPVAASAFTNIPEGLFRRHVQELLEASPIQELRVYGLAIGVAPLLAPKLGVQNLSPSNIPVDVHFYMIVSSNPTAVKTPIHLWKDGYLADFWDTSGLVMDPAEATDFSKPIPEAANVIDLSDLQGQIYAFNNPAPPQKQSRSSFFEGVLRTIRRGGGTRRPGA